MKPLTLQQVSQRVGGELWGPPDETVTGVTTDSRKVARGDLFVALRGARHDGHRYLDAAFAGGAVAAVAERERVAARPERPLVVVADSRAALGRLAAACRRDFDLPVVAVAGSNGKTTVKELLAALLRERGETLASPASYNNDVGVPLTLLALHPRHRAAVVEVGTNHPGELAALLEWVRPKHGVLTSIGAEHLEFFGDLEGVAREESALAAALPANGRLFVNGDTPGLDFVRHAAAAAPVIRVGWSAGCDWRITAAVIDLRGTTFTLRAPRPEFAGAYFLPLLGRHQVVNAALAVAAAAELGVPPAAIRRGLAAARPAPMRLEPVALAGRILLNDAYNANADSMIAALETLADVAGERPTVAVLGPMAELGARAAEEHARVGRAAAWHGIDRVVAVGPETAPLSRAARASGVPAVDECPDLETAAALLTRTLPPDAVALVKASRAARLERLVTELKTRLTADSGTPSCCTT